VTSDMAVSQMTGIGKVIADLEQLRRKLLMRRPYSQNVVADEIFAIIGRLKEQVAESVEFKSPAAAAGGKKDKEKASPPAFGNA